LGARGAPVRRAVTTAAVPRRRLGWLLLAVAVTTVLAAAPGAGVRATFGAHTTADEPHYLLTALSLWEDGDLDVADELADERYRPFHEIRLSDQAAPAADGRRVAPHDPLLPLLLAAPMGLGGWVAAKLALALLAGALAAATVWLAVRRFDVRPGVATVTVGLLAASVPLAPYGTQVYPEVPAALATVLAVAAATGPARPRTAVGLVLAVTALPWLAVKYVPVAATVAVIGLWRWWRAGARPLVLAAVAGFLLSGLAYVVGHLAWYGGLTVYAAGDFFQEHGGQLTVVGTAPDYLGRARRLVGLLVDDEFGVAAWQPAWLLLAPAIGAILRRADARAALLAPLVAGWLTATFLALTMQGWWFPGRQIVVVLPLAAVAIADLAQRSRPWLATTVAAGAVGVVSYAFLVVEGLRGQLRWVIDFATTANPWYRVVRHVLPDYLDVTWRTWALQTVWIVVLAGAAVAAWRSTQTGRSVSGAGSS
ncbi:MAG: hypothetical protein KY461_13960, partial [Actinobacteria bacterium]|nr:hypothetical protein [Actinomycetota bacterium]